MNLTKLFLAVTAFAAVALAQVPSSGSISVRFLTIPSCVSPSTSYSFNALSLITQISTDSTSSAGDRGGRGSAAQLIFGDLGLTKSVDDCSIRLYTLLFKQQLDKQVTISLFTDMTTESLRITLANVTIDSISDSGTSGALPVEKVSLNFTAISILNPITGNRTCWNRITATATCDGV